MKKLMVVVMAIFAISLQAEFTEQKGKKMPQVDHCYPVPPVKAPEGSKPVVYDVHGNFWTIAPAEKKGQNQIMAVWQCLFKPL